MFNLSSYSYDNNYQDEAFEVAPLFPWRDGWAKKRGKGPAWRPSLAVAGI